MFTTGITLGLALAVSIEELGKLLGGARDPVPLPAAAPCAVW